jgi:hypothetical protein
MTRWRRASLSSFLQLWGYICSATNNSDDLGSTHLPQKIPYPLGHEHGQPRSMLAYDMAARCLMSLWVGLLNELLDLTFCLSWLFVIGSCAARETTPWCRTAGTATEMRLPLYIGLGRHCTRGIPSGGLPRQGTPSPLSWCNCNEPMITGTGTRASAQDRDTCPPCVTSSTPHGRMPGSMRGQSRRPRQCL